MKNLIISHFLARKANNRSKNPSFIKRMIMASVIRRKLKKRDTKRGL